MSKYDNTQGNDSVYTTSEEATLQAHLDDFNNVPSYAERFQAQRNQDHDTLNRMPYHWFNLDIEPE